MAIWLAGSARNGYRPRGGICLLRYHDVKIEGKQKKKNSGISGGGKENTLRLAAIWRKALPGAAIENGYSKISLMIMSANGWRSWQCLSSG